MQIVSIGFSIGYKEFYGTARMPKTPISTGNPCLHYSLYKYYICS